MGVDPHVELPALRFLGRCRNGIAPTPIDVPRILTIDHEALASIPLRRRPATPPESVLPRGGVVARFTIELLDHGSGVPVHGPRVVRQGSAAWPIHFEPVQPLLPHHTGVGGPRDGHAAQVRGPDGLSGRPQDGARIEIAER